MNHLELLTMSVDLNAELNAFRAMIVTLKDDIIRQRDAVSISSINAAVRYHFLSIVGCVSACLLICRCLYVSNGLFMFGSLFVSMFVGQRSVDRRSACLSASV